MKKIFILLALIAFGEVRSQGIEFEHGSWAEVKKKASEKGKFIMVDCYTTWCGPCKWMAKNIFTNDTAGQFYNKDFVNYTLDMEKGEGMDFAKTYNVNVYPTFLFFDKNAELVHRVSGSKATDLFINDGKNAIDQHKQLYSLEKKFMSGNRDPEFLKSYCLALSSGYQKNDQAVAAYIEKVPERELLSSESFSLLSQLSPAGSEGFKFIIEHKSDFIKVTKEKQMDQYIEYSLVNPSYAAGKKNDEAKLKQYKESLKEIDASVAKELSAKMDYFFYKGAKNLDKEYLAAVEYIDNYKLNDPNELNGVSWTIFEHNTDRQKLEKALAWAKKSVELKAEYANTDTYANLLFKLGNNKEAEEWAKKSIEMGKKNGENTEETDKLLQQIQGKMVK